MPVRRTKRGPARTPIEGDYDVIICGASFAGLCLARELAGMHRADGSVARVVVLDRYEIGERQTSACATPTGWLEALDLTGSLLQSFDTLVLHSPHTTAPYRLPWSFSTFDYPMLCSLLSEQTDAEFEIATVRGHQRDERGSLTIVETDRGNLRAGLVVDALGWRRVLGSDHHQPPHAPLSRGLEVHPAARGGQLEIWIDRELVPAGYGWSFPAADEVRIGVGSFEPSDRVREPTVRLAGSRTGGFQGNWIPHKLRSAVEQGVFFVGDSAGHCFPLTAEGIRTAFYFGIACGRELRRVVEGRAHPGTAARRYAAFSERHRWQFESMLRCQRLVPRVPPRLLAVAARAMSNERFTNWAFNHYLKVAHPSFASSNINAAQASAAMSQELIGV